MLYFQYLFQENSCWTLLFYTALTLAIFVLGCLSQRRQGNAIVFERKWFFAACALLWAVCFFTNVGTDYPTYVHVYADNTWELVVRDTELQIEHGFRLLCYLMRFVIPNADLGLGILKTAMMALMLYAIYRMRNELHMGTALGAYAALFYYTSFSLLRFCFTSAMVLLAWVNFLEGKNKKGLLWLLLAVLLHKTMLLCAAVYALYYVTRKVQTKKLFIALSALLIPVLLLCRPFLQWLVTLPLFEKYIYYVSDEMSFGIMQFVFYAPVAAVFLFSKLPEKQQSRNLLPMLALMGFAIAMMGYTVGMVARFYTCFAVNFVILIPMFVHQVRRKELGQNCGTYLTLSPRYHLSYRLTMLLVILYFGMRFVIDIGELMDPWGLYPYTTWLF